MRIVFLKPWQTKNRREWARNDKQVNAFVVIAI